MEYTSKNPRPIPLDYCKRSLVIDPDSQLPTEAILGPAEGYP